ncbi:MAG: hypothetical protein ACYC97_05625 [Metallibacterium sp.]
MSEINVLEQDLSNFVVNVEKEVDVIFTDIVKGSSYAGEIIGNILTNAIPVAEAVVSVIDKPALVYVEMFATILGDIKATAKNVNTTAALVAATVTPGGNISTEQATALATSAQTTYDATLASITDISSRLSNIVKNSVVTVAKGA